MRANLDKRTGLYVLENEPQAPHFQGFSAGLGYLDPKGKDHYARHWFVVVGETEGHEYHFQVAESGDLLTIAKSLTNWKDDLCIQKVFLDGTDLESMRFLRGYGPSGWDGLTQYKSEGEDKYGREKYLHQASHWPNFRDRDTTAQLIPVPDSIRVNLMANYDLLLTLEKQDRVKYRPEALMISTVRREDSKDDVINHPLIRAATWTIAMLERIRPTEGTFKQPEPVYGNLVKR